MKINWFQNIALKISLLFKNNENEKMSKNSSKENTYFGEQFNEFLKIEDCLFCYQMMDEGYKPSKSNLNTLNKILVKKLENHQYSYNDIEKIKSLDTTTKIIGLINSTKNYSFNNYNHDSKPSYENKVIDLFKDIESIVSFLDYTQESMKWLKKYYSSGIDITGDFYSKTSEQNDHVTNHNSTIIYIASTLMNKNLLNSQQIQSIRNWFTEAIEHIENKTAEKHKSASFNRIEKSSLDRFVLKVADYQTKQLSKGNKKEDLIRQLKSYQSRQISLNEEMKHLVINEEHSIDNLPISAKSQVERITNLVNKMNNEEVNDFIKERMPVILKKYFSIDEEYRTTLKNVEGFNAQELMQQSLDNIEKILLAKKEDSNIDLLSELSVENRKIKMKVV